MLVLSGSLYSILIHGLMGSASPDGLPLDCSPSAVLDGELKGAGQPSGHAVTHAGRGQGEYRV